MKCMQFILLIVLGIPMLMYGATTSEKGSGIVTLVNNASVPLKVLFGSAENKPITTIEPNKSFSLDRALFSKEDLKTVWLSTHGWGGLTTPDRLNSDGINVTRFPSGVILKFSPSPERRKDLIYVVEESKELIAEREEKETKEKKRRESREREKARGTEKDPDVYMIATTQENTKSKITSEIIITTGPLFDQKVSNIVSPENPTPGGRSEISRKIWSHLGEKLQDYITANALVFSGEESSHRPIYTKLTIAENPLTEGQAAITELYSGGEWLQFKKTDGTINRGISYIVHAVAPSEVSELIPRFYTTILKTAQNEGEMTIAFPLIYKTPLAIQKALQATINFLNNDQHEGVNTKNVYFVFDDDKQGHALAQQYAQILYEIAQDPLLKVTITYDKDGIGKKLSEQAATQAVRKAKEEEVKAAADTAIVSEHIKQQLRGLSADFSSLAVRITRT